MSVLLNNLLKKGELPEVKVEVAISRDSILDIAATAVIVVIILTLLNKFIFNKL